MNAEVITKETDLDEYREQISVIDRDIIRELVCKSQQDYTEKEEYEWWLESNFVGIIQKMLQEDVFQESFKDSEGRLLNLLSKRFEIVEQVGIWKKERGIDPYQPEQWERVKKSRKQWAYDAGFLDLDWMDRFLEAIHEYAISIENNVTLSPQGLTKVPDNVAQVLK